MTYDQDKKRALLAEWFGPLMDPYSVEILAKGTYLEPASAIARIRSLAEVRPGPVVYALFVREQDEWVPVYFGRSDDVVGRWEDHFDGLARGRGRYLKWRQRLLGEGATAMGDACLIIVPEGAIAQPPIPGFPTSIGSVEYQLIGLASDAYPGMLLNSEGNRR